MHQTILRLLTVILMTAGFFGGVRCYAYSWSGSGTTADPYLIKTEADWNEIHSNFYSLYTNKSFKLTADLAVNVEFDDFNNYFTGTFDGNGHRISFTKQDNNSYLALFRFIKNATIKNLKVEGTITTNNKFAGGIVGQSKNSTIQNCVSSVTINSGVSGDGSHGGIVGMVDGKTTVIKDCIFKGQLLGSNTNNCGGLVGAGWNFDAECSILNCLFAPKEVTMSTSGSATISRCAGTISSCYYKSSFGTTNGQGTDASSMSTADLVAGLNTGATSGNESWVLHKSTLYLKPFDQYVDMTGWLEGSTPNYPVLHGGHPTIVNCYYTDNYTGYGLVTAPTTAGYYRVSASPQTGKDDNQDLWWAWDVEPVSTYMDFCIVRPPIVAAPTYNGSSQDLFSQGAYIFNAPITVYYKLRSGGSWSTTIPQAKDAGTYTVDIYVKGNEMVNDIGSEDSPAVSVNVTIASKPVNSEVGNLKIELPATMTYTGSALTPTVTVKDGDTVIDPSEYTVSYSNNVNVPESPVTVTITDKDGGNYNVSGTATFTITKADPTYTAPTAKDLTYNMNVQELINPGSTSHGTFEYSTDGTNFTTVTTGFVGTEAKDYLIYYRLIGDANHNDVGNLPNPPLTLTVTIKPKPITEPEILISPDVYYYDGTAKQPAVTVRDGGTVIPTSEYSVIYSDNVNAGTAKVTLQDTPGGNYAVSGSKSFSIIAQQPGVTPPTSISGLIYNTAMQNLIMVGTAVGGTMEYSLDGINFSTAIPQGRDAQQYTISYRVKGDGNHEDTDPVTIYATINPKTVSSPVISLSSTSIVYDGTEQKPDLTVKDGNTVIDPSEYTVEYSNNVNVGTAMVIIMDKNGGNYIVNGSTTFQIISADTGITPPTPKTDLVYNGMAQVLINEGKAEGGTMEYSLDRNTYTNEAPTGTDAKEYKVYYRVRGDSNHGDESAASLSVTISPKKLSQPEIILNPANYIYDGTEKQPAVTVKDGELTVPASEYTVKYSNNKNAGTGTVTLIDNEGGNYIVSGQADFSIIAAVAGVTLPEAKTGLVYNGKAQELVTPGSTVGGTMEYSLDNKNYSTKVPTGTDAQQYTVYFRVVGDADHASIDPVSMTVTINAKSVTNPVATLEPSILVYDGTEQKPEVTIKDGDTGVVIPASEYTVSYSNNVNIGTGMVTITDNPGGNYTVSLTISFTIYDPKLGFQAPKAISGLVYNGKEQNLVTAGMALESLVLYSLDDKNYSTAIPSATNAGTYKVSYKVVNEEYQVDRYMGSVRVTIEQKLVFLSISLKGSPESVPQVTVTDAQGNLMNSSDYSTVITDKDGNVVTPVGNKLAVGDYVLIVTPIGNYMGPSVTVSFHVRRAYSFVFTMQSDVIGVCLPFDRTVPNGYHVYYFDRVGSDGYPVFKRILLDKLVGGEPYLLKYVGSSSAREGTRATRTIDLSPSSPGLIDLSIQIQSQTYKNVVYTGIFDDMNNTKGLSEGAYLLQADKTWKPLDKSLASRGDDICLEAFQTYLRYKDRSTPEAYLKITMMAENGDVEPDPDPVDPPSAINAIILEDLDGHQEWYDMQGRRIEKPQKGVNILRTEDGKTRKVVIR